MNYTDDERAFLWLCCCAKTDYHHRVMLLHEAPSPAALLKRPEQYFSLAPGAVFTPDAREREAEADALLESLERKGYFAVTLIADDYPESLKHISLPPLLLFGKGNRRLLKKRKFCIVGSRITPPWAENLARKFAEELSARFAVVTGLAEGGDSAAIAGALPSGNLISVLPCGLDECYPAAHASIKAQIGEHGLLLSELLPGETAKKYSFHARNRLLAGLSEGVLVVSAAEKSGTLITANCALEFGRDVFAFPHNVGSAHGEGCNELIKKGAYVATCPADVFSLYGMQAPQKKEKIFTGEEMRVLTVLRDYGELHTAVIAEKVGMSAYEVAAILSALEIKGAAVKSGGNKYSAV